MPNEEIRKLLKCSGVRQWKVAERLGVHESVLCRKLRKELTMAEKQRVLDTIAALKGGENE